MMMMTEGFCVDGGEVVCRKERGRRRSEAAAVSLRLRDILLCGGEWRRRYND
jgi:hypothetical protein